MFKNNALHAFNALIKNAKIDALFLFLANEIIFKSNIKR